MTSARSGGRTWLPAVVAPVVLVGLFVGSWALNRSALGDDSVPDRPGSASLWRWLVEANNGFWGLSPFSTADDGRALTATLVSAVVVLLLGFGGTWAVLRGMRPGSAAFAAFASTWLVLAVSSVLGEIVWWLVVNRDRLDQPGAGEAQFASLTNGLQYAAKYGWIAALATTLVWVLVRPPAPEDAGRRDGELGPPEGYPSARAGYYRARAYEEMHEEARDPLSRTEPPSSAPSSAPSSGPASEPSSAATYEEDRLAALRAQVEAEAASEGAAPAEQPAPDQPAAVPAAGRRSSGVYADEEPGGPGDTGDAGDARPSRRPTGPYGTHRAATPEDDA